MVLEVLQAELSVCQVRELRAEDLSGSPVFVGKTDEELSLVCESSRVPENALAREDGWRAFRIRGVLDFSLIGILAPIADILAKNRIGIFVSSTYNTDYVLVRAAQLERAMRVLEQGGYTVVWESSDRQGEDNA